MIQLPPVLFDLADVLPNFQGEGLESQLQTFDSFLMSLGPEARPGLASLLRMAAARTREEQNRQRIEEAAQSIADGGRAAAPYDHQAAMRAYQAQHAKNFGLQPPERGTGRLVTEADYQQAIRHSLAVKDTTLPSRSIGEVERWIAADGRVVAWLIVRYFKGEEDYDYYVSAAERT